MIYDIVVGLEIHVELSTATKIFCGCKTTFGCPPNTNVCPVCMGYPGTLPVLNREVLNKAIEVGMATNCHIASLTTFDRKNYFYPDNPKNYQISQLYNPICKDGYVTINTANGEKKIGIDNIHMEEDAGKLIHSETGGETLVDFNRAGVPLIEIVTEPDMESIYEVKEFLNKLRLCIQYTGASDCKLNEGSMRVDVNLSVKKQGDKKLGVRTEMKNLNSIKAIEHAIDHEAKRQIAIIESGGRVESETRKWDENGQCSYLMRGKEDSRDYRYFPEPDIPALSIDKKWLTDIRSRLPEQREEKMRRYKVQYNLPDYDIEVITGNVLLLRLFEEAMQLMAEPKSVSNWLMGETIRIIRENGLSEDNLKISSKALVTIIDLVKNGKINNTVAKRVYQEVIVNNVDPEEYIRENGLEQEKDAKKLTPVIQEVIKENEQSVMDYRAGKTKAIGYLIGQTMKKMGGKASPDIVSKILIDLLEEKIY